MLEQLHTVEFVKRYGDWKPGERADFSSTFSEFLEFHGYAKIVGARVRQKARRRKG